MEEIRFDIVKHIGIINESQKGWARELNMVSWNGRGAKYDIREWSPDHRRMGKGLTFTENEFDSLRSLMQVPGRPEQRQQRQQSSQTQNQQNFYAQGQHNSHDQAPHQTQADRYQHQNNQAGDCQAPRSDQPQWPEQSCQQTRNTESIESCKEIPAAEDSFINSDSQDVTQPLAN